MRRPATSREWSDGSRSCRYIVPHSAQVLEASVDGVGVFPLRFCCDVLTWAVKQAPIHPDSFMNKTQYGNEIVL